MIDDYSLRSLFLIPAISMARVATCLYITPFFSNSLLTGAVRNGTILSLSLLVVPTVEKGMPADFTVLGTAVIIAKEAFIGLVIGYVASVPFWVASSIGLFVDTQRGTGMASIFDPNLGEQTSPIGVFLLQILVTLFYASSGILMFLGILYGSFRLMPVFSFFPVIDMRLPAYILALTDHLMYMIVVLSAPMIVAMFLIDFSLGLVNRFAPSLNVFFLSMPVKSGVAFLILILYTTSLMTALRGDFLNYNSLRALFSLFSK